MANNKTIKRELQELGIELPNFETFYATLTEKNALPPQEAIPKDQYDTILSYLTGKKLLTEGVVDQEKLLIFRSIKFVEDLEEKLPRRWEYDLGSNGGFSPCRNYSRSSGGFAPCRY